MKSTILSAMLCLLLPLLVKAQGNPRPDSLEKELSLPHPDSVQVSILNKLAAQYMRFDMARAGEKLKRSQELTDRFVPERWSDEMSFQRSRAHTQLTVGNMFFRQGKYSECLQFYFEALRIYEKTGDQLGQAKALNGIGSSYNYFSDYDNALMYMRRAEPLFEKSKNLTGLLSVKGNIGSILSIKNRLGEALDEMRSVGEIAERNELWEVAGGAWQNVMSFQIDMGNLEQASESGERAMHAIEKTTDRLNLGLLLTRIANIHYLKKEYARARVVSQQTLDIGKELNNQLLIRAGYTNLASAYLEEAKISNNAALKDSFYVRAVDLLTLEKAFADTVFSKEKSVALAEMQVKYETEKKEREISQLNADAKNRKIEALQREIELRQEKINAERAKQEAVLLEKINENIKLDLEVKEARLQEQNTLGAQKQKDIELLQLKTAQQSADARNERFLRYGLLIGLMAFALFSFLLYRNIRRRMQAQQKIEQQRAEIAQKNADLEAANAYKSIFLSNMSHEIRTPLNTIIGMSDLLQESELDSRQRNFASVIRHASANLLSIINEILDFSKIEAGKMEIRPETFDLYNLVERQVQLLQLQAAQKKIGLEWNIDADVPQYIVSDPGRLSQILLNLLSNAVKFTEKGKVQLAVKCMSEGRESQKCRLHFSILDTGIGIAPEQMATIFEPFIQAGDDTHLRHSGTGLGLAIARQLIELQGGRISAVSESGKGSEFSFFLPVEIGAPFTPTQTEKSGARLRGTRILLVEDNQFNQMLAMELLQKLVEAPVIVLAENGQEAVQVVSSDTFDLILMDVKMPVMDGFAATRAIREMRVGTPIIALTANATSEERDKCLAQGMDDYLSKPIAIELLEEKLNQWGG